MTVQEGKEVVVGHELVDEQLLVTGVVLSLSGTTLGWRRPPSTAMWCSNSLLPGPRRRGPRRRVAEPLHGHDAAVVEHRFVRRPTAALAKHLRGHVQQILRLESLRTGWRST
jgi:hypothetical protein